MRVWAPAAERVDLVTDKWTLPMDGPDERGWWSAPSGTTMVPGDRYAFAVDGGPTRPDPRSPSQPDGVDAPSEVVDHGAFPWSDGGWQRPSLDGAIVYELHVGTFSAEGTFAGVGEHLHHLLDLGVTHVELMPVN
ncbi:MAG TPA: hypothetical protein VF045_08980, partial [Acidimicrobiales bacterium]